MVVTRRDDMGDPLPIVAIDIERVGSSCHVDAVAAIEIAQIDEHPPRQRCEFLLSGPLGGPLDAFTVGGTADEYVRLCLGGSIGRVELQSGLAYLAHLLMPDPNL